jgi:hypothetical protein
MQPFRILLTGLIVAGLALANSPSHAVEWWWFKQKQTYKAIPGGPQVVKLPDLVVDSINPKLSDLKCLGKNNFGFVPVSVTIRNQGSGTAVWKSSPWGPWYVVFASPAFAGSVNAGGYDLQKLTAGSTQTFPQQSLTVMTVAKPDKIGITVIANSDHVIAESDYTNNTRVQEIGGVFCP